MPKASLAIEVRRDYDGKVFSQIVDVNERIKKNGYGGSVVIDRQNGRMHDFDSVLNRAKAISELTALPYVEDLTWPCKAERGYKDCACPKCAERSDSRAKK